MKFLKNIFDRSKKSSLHPPLKQSEREAIVDLLLMGTYVDSHLSIKESRNFESVTDSLSWESDLDLLVYIDDATVRVRNARSNEETIDGFISYVAKRLISKGSRERALELLNHLLRSDEKTDIEKAFFQQVETAFDRHS